ncbi:LPS-assembly lipoprotein [Candidatus Photodesmus blepharus]|uniref:LPS-assembly lipoprotein LptE n=1 Tax=Candidatus Photodesmus blepharonis TaxID=1179155 RepID=A0A084CPJ4_9GAMM|nr:LPS assembly lipoprotein LptE [Candidatus Photodesmus blepharus]KEY91723.1 LPS-assembly lipoprotein [Candidatus Photodesmus blepharus]
MPSIFRKLRPIYLFLTASFLSACSFHLREDFSTLKELNKISLTSYDQYSTLTRMVKNALRIRKIQIVPAESYVPSLSLIDERINRRTLSLYQNTRHAEIELTLTVTYKIKILNLESKIFSTNVTRSYLDNPFAALTKSIERNMIENEMRKLAATQIIGQIERLRL